MNLCPVCEKFSLGAIKGVAIKICGDCLVKVEAERVTLGDMIRKRNKGDS